VNIYRQNANIECNGGQWRVETRGQQ